MILHYDFLCKMSAKQYIFVGVEISRRYLVCFRHFRNGPRTIPHIYYTHYTYYIIIIIISSYCFVLAPKRPSVRHIWSCRLLRQIVAAGLYRYNSGLKIILFNIPTEIHSLASSSSSSSSYSALHHIARDEARSFECSLYIIILLWSSDRRRATEAVRFLFYDVYIK